MGFRIKRPAMAAIIGLFLALLFAYASPGLSAQQQRLEPHDFRGHGLDCRSCHISVSVKQDGGLRKPVSEICGGCHRLPHQNHPVDMVPTLQVPPDLPLDKQGKLTCATCHDPHRPYLNPLTGNRTMYLRRDGPNRGLCLACHAR